MKVVKVVSTVLLTLGITSAFAANGDLVITNNTDFPSTVKINRGSCSNKLPGGITQPHTTNTVPKAVVGLACLGHASNCVAEVYMTNNCTGSVVAEVVFDTSTGVKSVIPYDNHYLFTYNENDRFKTQIDAVK